MQRFLLVWLGALATAALVLCTAPAAPASAASVSSALSPASAGESTYLAAPTPPADWPSGEIVAITRRFDPPAQPWLPGHRGVDLLMTVEAPVYAAQGGTVIFAGELVDRSVVSIEAPGGLRFTYEPVLPIVEEGEEVSRGQVIGHLAPGHGKTGTCLHFGVKRGAEDYLDPLLFLWATIRLYPPTD